MAHPNFTKQPDDATGTNSGIRNDNRFQKLLENSYSGITLLDKNFKVTYRSASAERIGGWDTANRMKVKMDALVHPDDYTALNLLLNQVLVTPGIPNTCQFRSKHFDGHYIWLECTFTNMFNEPDVKAIVCNFRDISSQKLAEAQLNQTILELSAYKHALDESAIVAITDQKGIIRHVNQNFCNISKYTEDELLGQDHRIINSSFHTKPFIGELWATIAKGKLWQGELKNKAKDGTFYWVNTTIVPFLNDDGKPYQYVAIRSDITERKLAEEKIIESERFIKTITDNLPAMIGYWTTDLHCLFANKPYQEWFDKTHDEIIGISKLELMDEEEYKTYFVYINNVLHGLPQSFERTFHNIKGKTIFTHTQYLPDKDGDKVVGFYSLIYDLTEVKLAEREVNKKNKQIENLLENITDGFIALDNNRCYTYANQQIGQMVGRPVSELLGKNIWDLFPDVVGSATYQAIETAFIEKRYVCNEDFYPPLKLWQENRAYPTETGVSVFIRDITKKKQEEHHLKLLESVITNTNDAILITEAEPFDELGPRILYVNEAFTKLTGYAPNEVIGKTPRILQGPKTDKQELKRLSDAMRSWQPCEVNLVNYKKSGEEFWINLSISPVADETGWYTHWVSVDKDITQRKNEELQNALLSELNLVFNEPLKLRDTLKKVLEKLVGFGGFDLGEAWLIGTEKDKINRVSNFSPNDKMQAFFTDSGQLKSFKKGEGLPGIAWESKAIQFWENIDSLPAFARKNAAKKAGLKAACAIPLINNNDVIGVLLLASKTDKQTGSLFKSLLNSLGKILGPEVKRKQLEQELNQIFNFAPDIICTVGTDGYFKTFNPALPTLLGYTGVELTNKSFIDFVFPADINKTQDELKTFVDGKPTHYFENRYITKQGKVKWLAWTTTPATEEGLIFCVAKEITDKKELEELLIKATDLAQIGGWEIDIIKGTIYWSAITKEIHETAFDFEPDLQTAIEFYKEGESRAYINQFIKDAIENGTRCDVELQILTAKGNTKWIRVIGEAEFVNNKCVRVYGSFQDIDARKKAEIAATEVLEEKNIILESIGDAFFAVDKTWRVTYWNKMAEKVLGKSKSEMINHQLWDIFAGSINSESYMRYQEAITRQKSVHFEDYYQPLDKWYEISAYPSLSGLSVYFKDITNRKNADSQLKEINQHLQKQTRELAISNAELEQFAYVASHDLQEPLRMVTSFMSQLEKKYSDVIDERGKLYINFAVDGAKRMRQIILDLLEFSRIGRTDDELEEINLNRLIQGIMALYHKQIDDRSAVIELDDLPSIRIHKTPIRQIFQNLISNALKYQRPYVPPLIHIGCTDFDDHWQFEVKDNGIGISQEYFDKIFVIFQRLHNKDEYSGTGMGLAIVKKIIENWGGKIWIESEEGDGTTFYFTILKNRA